MLLVSEIYHGNNFFLANMMPRPLLINNNIMYVHVYHKISVQFLLLDLTTLTGSPQTFVRTNFAPEVQDLTLRVTMASGF